MLHFLETDFEDFMSDENIKVVEGKPKEIQDVKWGIYFNHDVKLDYIVERKEIKQKYQRRIEKLKQRLKRKEKVCFIRAVRDKEEIEYIIEHISYIENVIKKENRKNDILFLIPQYLYVPETFPFKKYMLRINVYQGNFRSALRDMFDTNQVLIDDCRKNYSAQKLLKNRIFDLEKENNYYKNSNSSFAIEKRAIQDVDAAYAQISITESRCQRLLAVVKCDFDAIDFPPELVIYGAGDIGKLVYDRIKRFVKIPYFLDKKPLENQYDGVDIIKPENYIPSENMTIIIIPTYEYDMIKETLVKLWSVSVRIIGLEDFLRNRM